jgi:hypothetical protein
MTTLNTVHHGNPSATSIVVVLTVLALMACSAMVGFVLLIDHIIHMVTP